MAAITRADLLSTLRTKVDAEEDPQRRHNWFKVKVGGVLYATTMVSHGGSSEIGQPLLGKVARQLRLSSSQLTALVSCELDREAYYRLLEDDREPSE